MIKKLKPVDGERIAEAAIDFMDMRFPGLIEDENEFDCDPLEKAINGWVSEIIQGWNRPTNPVESLSVRVSNALIDMFADDLPNVDLDDDSEYVPLHETLLKWFDQNEIDLPMFAVAA